MITIKDFMEAVNYRITDGAEYQWQCYGPNARSMDSWNGSHDGHSVGITFDTETQEVYEASVYDYSKNRAYRLLNPAYEKTYRDEAKSRGVDDEQAYDDVRFIDLEVEEDFLKKTRAIMNGEDYSELITIKLDLDRELIFDAAMAAHDEDITLNQFMNKAFQHAMDMRDWAEKESKPG